jgi:hypothetical protein
MLFIRGVRKARIKTYEVQDRQCENCKDFHLRIKVYKDYYHAFFIPFVPAGVKSSVISCNSCGCLIRFDSLSKEYESKTKIPFYLYSGVLLVALFVLSMFGVSVWGQHERSTYISNPKVGDVYLIKNDSAIMNGYNFVKVKGIAGDSVIAYPNHLLYLTETSAFSSEDYFDADQEVGYTKAQLKQLFDSSKIENVFRDYENATGFNRMR